MPRALILKVSSAHCSVLIAVIDRSAVFGEDDNNKQTLSLGELFTLVSVIRPAVSFTGPVYVIDGEFDFIFCQADCNQPTDQTTLVLESLFPSARKGSQTSIVPGVGHAINVHIQAPTAFKQMLDFVQGHGF